MSHVNLQLLRLRRRDVHPSPRRLQSLRPASARSLDAAPKVAAARCRLVAKGSLTVMCTFPCDLHYIQIQLCDTYRAFSCDVELVSDPYHHFERFGDFVIPHDCGCDLLPFYLGLLLLDHLAPGFLRVDYVVVNVDRASLGASGRAATVNASASICDLDVLGESAIETFCRGGTSGTLLRNDPCDCSYSTFLHHDLD